MPAESATLSELARLVGGEVVGDGDRTVTGVAAIDEATADQITWATESRYVDKLSGCKAGAVVVGKNLGDVPMPSIVCDDPEAGIALIMEHLAPPTWVPEPGVHPTAVVSASATLGKHVAIGPYSVVGDRVEIGAGTQIHGHVVIGPDVTIGPECVVWPNVVIRERSELGARVVVHPHVTIGADGFGYRFADGRHNKIPQTGMVSVGDDVEIGAGSCIDRAKVGRTVIGPGTKIDNLCQIAHNVEIGPHCVLVAQVGIAGSSRLGGYVVLGGQVGVRDHVSLGDAVQAAACCCIAQDVQAGQTVGGIPARDAHDWLRQQAALRKLPALQTRLREIERRIASLEASTNDRQAD